MDLGPGIGHLTYSTLVHPSDTWSEMWDSLNRYVPAVKQRVAPDKPFGVSLRISGASADALTAQPDERAKLKAFLDDNEMYLYTVNAFPQEEFKNRIVMEQVFEPDWRTDARAEYTMKVADILAEVVPEGVNPSIQTPPLGFKPRVTGPEVVDAYTRQVLRVCAHMARLRDRTGRTVTLAIEPEPFCYLETTDEAVDYFTNHLFAASSVDALSGELGVSAAEADDILHRHLGMVFDICHQAVEFENISVSLQKLVDAGIPVFKLQEAAAVMVPEVNRDVVEALKPYTDTVYLTQTFQMRDGVRSPFLKLAHAIDAWEADPGPAEWRTHFHVPVFLDDLGPFRTTRFAIEEALAFHKANPLSDQLEIETYTWDVLPNHLKTGDIVDYVSRELEWVQGQLA